ncbi:DUF6401 family natural product biosynthesis protein [Nocardia sp. NBC_00508]|uniref:DUF6401 family natural product biosynthesis protein n=1 Tax=Nocardia sp. NBC_00508 TaxID=2975992 RepID=UPI002E801A8C|nr:DUF6401 family natural product biosynthesis protein [Nocardia sp. NBC_00508]WUD64141.1 DUF6401 family natural product biosynthesis protein [Nocardia sp. NBC_00508]
MFFLGPAMLEVSARRTLNRLHQTHGAPALAAAALLPALSAALDQHAAAVRDILQHGVPDATNVPATVLLAGYARGLLDQAREASSAERYIDGLPDGPGTRDTVPADVLDWAEADWIHLRLAGVCLHGMRNPAESAPSHLH